MTPKMTLTFEGSPAELARMLKLHARAIEMEKKEERRTIEREETNRAEETNRVFVFRKLSSGGHDEYEKGSTEEIQAEFTALLAGGYALFVDEVQVRSLEEAVGYWDTLFPTIK